MLTYAAVGATRDVDLLARPPAGFRPLERLVRIGDGEEHWAWASTEVMTLGVQRRSGLRPVTRPGLADGSRTLRLGDRRILRLVPVRIPFEVVYAFSRPAHPVLWLGYPVLRALQEIYTRRYERALIARG